jgi:hypothetical protein
MTNDDKGMSDEIVRRIAEWPHVNILKSYVDRLFEQLNPQPEAFSWTPVTNWSWFYCDEEPIEQEKDIARRALLAREHFALFGPPDAPPLPVSYGERELLKGGGLPHIVAWFARSLEAKKYDLQKHPKFEVYARGVMASEYAPDFITKDEGLKRRFPPRPLKGLGPALMWQPAKKRWWLRQQKNGRLS